MTTRARSAARLALAAPLALAVVLAAGCASDGQESTGPATPSQVSSSAVEQPKAPTPVTQSAITVVAPPSTAPTASTHAVVTTTVTAPPSAPPPEQSSEATSDTSSAAPPSPPAPALAGKVVVIDPGHNGKNAAHPEIINKQVPAGFGETKPCNTTGTATNAGYAEHIFNWKVALVVRDALEAQGITVVMTRDSDDGVGPCVNKRAEIGNATYDGKPVDAVVSIHGDGEAASVQGFYVMTASRPPAGDKVQQQTEELAIAIRDGMAGEKLPLSNTLGSDGIWQRSDLAGLNLSERPTVMIECGNMRNAQEADLMSSKAGQQRYGDGIAAGIIAYLGG